MKKIFISFIFLLTFSLVKAQTDNRISAILDKEPANNEAELNANAAATAQLGEQGIVSLLGMLFPEGKGDNTKVFDAISGFSFYTTRPGKDAWRSMAVKAYCTALSKTNDRYNQAFIISQLQIVGKDDAVATLKKYLNDSRLCGPAARALVKVGSSAAKAALLQALPASKDSCKLSLVEALGDSRDASAVKSISALVGKDKNLDKVALYALAKIASPASVNLMANAGQKAGFNYDETNATSSYLLFINNLGRNGNAETAVRLAKALMTKASLAHQQHTRTAALKIMVDLRGAASVNMLISASHDADAKYRAAALKFASFHLTQTTIPLWIKELNKPYGTGYEEIIAMLGDNKVHSALPAVLNGLKSNHETVVVASVTAAGQIGQDKVLDNLMKLMYSVNSDDDDIGTAVKNALLIMKGNTVTTKVAKTLGDPALPPAAQADLVDILAARGAHAQIAVVMPLVNSKDDSVRATAYASLKHLAGEDNIAQLFALLSFSTSPTETADVQAAIIAAIKRSKDKTAQSDKVLKQMNDAPAERKYLYLNILAATGDKKSLAAVSAAYKQGDSKIKQASVVALSQWTNTDAAPVLLRIAQESQDAGLKDQALQGYVAAISRSDYPDDEKVIYLRDAMDAAQTVPQKKLILEQVSKNKTFPALVFVSKYQDDPQLQGDAADDVSSIALSSKDFYGQDVKLWLTKAMQIKKGGDADYEKVAIRKFIAEMPSDAGLVPLFNNKDLTGWKGLVGNPIIRSKMDAQTLAKEQRKADSVMRKGWYVKDSVLNFSGDGENICTTKQYRNFEMYVDWKIEAKGDAGIYLRGSPQVQIWDTSRVDVGAQVGSGSLYNNLAHQSKPLKLADNAIGDWNNFHIIMKGDKVTVYLNGVLVVDNVVMDNYWDRAQPIFPKEQIELQAHGTHVYYRDIYLRELPD